MRHIILLLGCIQAVAFINPTQTIIHYSPIQSRLLDAISYYNAQTTFTKQTHQSCERNIIILSHNVSRSVADGYFDVNSLLAGRIDVLARCISCALWISNGIRNDTNIYLMLFPHNITIEVRGSDVIELNPDERTTALCRVVLEDAMM